MHKSLIYNIIFIIGISILIIWNLEQIKLGFRATSKYAFSDDLYIWFYGISTYIVCVTLTVIYTQWSGKFIITPTVVFSLFHYLMVYPGAVFVDVHSYSQTASYYYIVSTILFVFGIRLSNIIFQFSPATEMKDYFVKIKNSRSVTKPEIFIIKIGLIFSIIIVALLQLYTEQSYSLGLTSMGNFEAITSGEGSALQGQREDLYKNGLSVFDYILRYFVRVIIPVLSLILIIHYMRLKRFYALFLSTTALSFGILIAIGSGSRMFVAHLLLVCLITVVNSRKINSQILITSVVFFISLLTAQTIALARFISNSSDAITIATMAIVRLFERIFLTKGVVTSYVFEYFPLIGNYRLGASYLDDLFGVISRNVPLSQEMFKYITGGTGTAGPQVFGEFYANFGFIGVSLSLILGCIIQSISILIVRKKSLNVVYIVITSYLTFLVGLIGYGKLIAVKSYGGHVLLIFSIFLFAVLWSVKNASKKT